MLIDRFVQFLVPKDKKFFPLFEKASGNMVTTSRVLVELVKTTDAAKRKDLIKEIERLEHEGDSITHEIFHELSSTFITPFDREDIHYLATAIDDVVDFVYGASKRFDLYRIDKITEPVIRLAELIHTGSEELHTAIVELKNMKNITKIKEACVRVNSVENQADDVFNTAIAQLFDEEKDPIYIIKMKEILSVLETATDKCEDAANIISSLIVKAS
jgi:predicted phosphate transport protein (TIGR00153 family)